MQDIQGWDNGNENTPPSGPGGEIVEVCGVQRENEPYPSTQIEPCPVHCGAKLRGERAGRKCTNYAMPNGRCNAR